MEEERLSRSMKKNREFERRRLLWKGTGSRGVWVSKSSCAFHCPYSLTWVYAAYICIVIDRTGNGTYRSTWTHFSVSVAVSYVGASRASRSPRRSRIGTRPRPPTRRVGSTPISWRRSARISASPRTPARGPRSPSPARMSRSIPRPTTPTWTTIWRSLGYEGTAPWRVWPITKVSERDLFFFPFLFFFNVENEEKNEEWSTNEIWNVSIFRHWFRFRSWDDFYFVGFFKVKFSDLTRIHAKEDFRRVGDFVRGMIFFVLAKWGSVSEVLSVWMKRWGEKRFTDSKIYLLKEHLKIYPKRDFTWFCSWNDFFGESAEVLNV